METPHSGRRRALATLALWLIATAALALAVCRAPAIRGDLDGLVPAEQRDPLARASIWLALEIHEVHAGDARDVMAPDSVADPQGPSHRLLQAADQIHRAFDGRWVPIAAPAQEVSAWLDRHLLALIAPESHAQLGERLTAASMQAAVLGIRARLTSPLFTASGEEPRRDPLGLRPLLQGVLAGAAIDPRAEATAAGDLLAADGRRLLLEIRGDDAPLTLVARARAAIDDRGVHVGAIGESLREANAFAQVRDGLRGPPITAAALALMLIALGVRRIRPALVVAAAMLTSTLLLLAIAGAIDLFSLTLLPLMIAIAGEGIPGRPRIAAAGWAAPAILAAALVPLGLAPYPLWRPWILAWGIAVAIFFVVARGGARAIDAALGPAAEARAWSLRLRPWPALAVLLCGGLLVAGAAAAESITIFGPAGAPLRDPAAAQVTAIRGDFFDPQAIATIDRRGDDLEDSLRRSIDAATPLADLPAGHLRLIDAPGSLIVDGDELERRQEALAGLAIPAAMRELEAAITAVGMRPSAFAEFLRGAAEQERPSAARALAGPLRAWIDGHARADGEATILRTRAFFADLGDVPTTIAELRGPAVADARDRAVFRDRLGLYAALGLWIGALVIWLATRSLALALAAALVGLASELGAIGVLVLLGLPLGPAMLPALLIVGAVGVIAGGRAGRAALLGEPLPVGPTLLAGLCPIAGGVALLAAPEPLWQAIGALVVGGSALAPGLGIFVAPGLHLLLRRLLREAGARAR